VIYSDLIIVLNQRDSQQLLSIYGRRADFLLPTSLVPIEIDTAISHKNLLNKSTDLNLLFVGINFYANVHGINWFIENVMTKVENVKLTIVGNGLNESLIIKNKNVIVYGRVESLDMYYKQAHIVVLPIFLGSGMKTKTAEALMHGKPILATSEALEGYIIENINFFGGRCDLAIEFIEKINYFKGNRVELFDLGINARNFFLSNHSNDAINNLFKNTIEIKLQELTKYV
jgi:glycosyltransferase involved in cell wall biosynthesis